MLLTQIWLSLLINAYRGKPQAPVTGDLLYSIFSYFFTCLTNYRNATDSRQKQLPTWIEPTTSWTLSNGTNRLPPQLRIFSIRPTPGILPRVKWLISFKIQTFIKVRFSFFPKDLKALPAGRRSWCGNLETDWVGNKPGASVCNNPLQITGLLLFFLQPVHCDE